MTEQFDEHCQQGCDYYTEGRFDESIAEFQSALAIAPDCFDLRNNVASAIHAKAVKSNHRRDWESASAAYRHAMAMKPEDRDLLEYIVQIDWKFGKNQLLLETLKAAILADPDNKWAYYMLFGLQKRMWDFRGSYQTVEALTERFPEIMECCKKGMRTFALRAAAVSTVLFAGVILLKVLKEQREEK